MKSKTVKNRITMRKASKTIPRGRAPDPKKQSPKMLPRVTLKQRKNY